MAKVLVAGTVSLDLVASEFDAETALAAVGNSGANIAVRLAAAGHEVQLICLLGEDTPGELAVADLHRWGVGTDWVVKRADYRTPIVFQVTDGNGTGADALFSACPKCQQPRGHDLLLPDVIELAASALDYAAAADLVLIDTPGGCGASLLAAANSGGKDRAGRSAPLTWYEASLREATAAEMIAAAAHARVVKCSAEDFDFYASIFERDAAPTDLQLLTQGSNGVDWRWGGDGSWQSFPITPLANPVDTIGAGDAFTVAVADALLHQPTTLAHRDQAELSNALGAGAAAGARACEYRGARGDMLSAGGPWIDSAVPFKCTRC